MIEITLPNGVKAQPADLSGVEAVFQAKVGEYVTFNRDITVMAMSAYFAHLARRLFNLTKCQHCQTWSMVKDNCGNCLRAERDIAQYNLKQERSKFELEEKNLAAANERIKGLENLLKTHNVVFNTHTEGCGCVWEFCTTIDGKVGLTKKQIYHCDGGVHFTTFLGIRVWRSNMVPKDSFFIISPD